MALTKVTSNVIANDAITSAMIAPGAIDNTHITGITTTDITEGTNQYYTDGKVGTYLNVNGYDTATNIISAITDTAPITLDTLNELAAALGDDPNFATTVTNSIATKLPLAGGTLTGALTGTTATFSGEITANGGIALGDNGKATFGAGDDLQIYHDGSNSYIDDVGTGDLVIRGSSAVYLQKYAGENMLKASADAGVQVFYNNSEKLATTATGIDVTGDVNTSGLIKVGANDTEYANNYIRFKPTGASYIDHSTVGQDINFRVSSASSLDKTPLTLKSDGTTFIDGGNGYFRAGIGNSYSSGWNANTDTHSTWINFEGYLGGTTKFRDLRIGNGKQTSIVHVEGSTGHVGIGVSPYPWGADYDVIDFNTGGAIYGTTTGLSVSANLYFTGSAWLTKTTGPGTLYATHSGKYYWYNSVSAAAGTAAGLTERMQLDAGGNLGIGGTPSAHRLEVKGDNNIAKFYSDATATELKIAAPTVNVIGLYTGTADALVLGTADQERMRIDSSGNIGIGFSAAPNAALQVAKGIAASPPAAGANTGAVCFGNDTSANAYGLVMGADGFGKGYISAQRTDGVATTYPLVIQPNGGNVGIGVVPSAFLLPNGSTGALQLQSGGLLSAYNANTYLSQNWYYNAGEKYMANGSASRYAQTGAEHIWSSAGNNTSGAGAGLNWQERMRINSVGNLLVGTLLPGEGINYGSPGVTTIKGSYGALIKSTGGTGYEALSLWNSAASGTMIQVYFRDGSGGTGRGSITTDGSGTQYNTTSDLRLKENIKTIDNSTEKLMAMNPVTHTWKAKPDAKPVVGFIAQEMMNIVPEAVVGDPEGEEMMGMDYGRITPIIVAALQDALKEIKELKTRISKMENK